MIIITQFGVSGVDDGTERAESVELMTITLDQARTKLTGSPWSPVELIGEGGGGAVFLCASTSIGQDLDAYGSLLMNTTTHHLGCPNDTREK